MEYNEEDFLMLSGIQHFGFCQRQWALIHIEMLWEENLRTIEGESMHEICHDSTSFESRKNTLISRGMPIFSRTLGASGECDIVEFLKDNNGISINGRDGKYLVRPVEYKRGEPKENDCDILQLAAQAICLEEMFLCEIKSGAIFYGQTKRRLEVNITDEVKIKVRESFKQMHSYYNRGYIPKVKPAKRCNACSLKNLCMPKLYKLNNVKKYMDEAVKAGGDGE